MSLHDAAQHLASQGRYGDNMLVHMNPREVAGLQALAEQKGVSLTRNPETGMPEAFGLGDLNPFRIVQGKGEIGESGFGSVLIGAALMAAGVPAMAFGPGALAGAGGAALLTGGASALMGGGLKGALSSGLGAYGGASMYGAMNPATAAPTPTPGGQVPPAAPTAPVQAAPVSATPTGMDFGGSSYAGNPVPPTQAAAQVATTTPPPTTAPTITGPLTDAQVDIGLGKAGTYTPVGEQSLMGKTGQFIKDYKWPLAGAATLGLLMEKPKGVEVENQHPGFIRPYIYDPQTQGLRALKPVKAPGYAEGGVSMGEAGQQYPMSDMNTADYAIPFQTPGNARTSGATDVGVNPYTGETRNMAAGGISHLGDYSDGGRLLKGPGDGVSDSIPAMIGKKQPARLADGEFVIPARIVSEIGNGSTEAGARKLYAMMDRVQNARKKTTGKNKVAANTRADKYLPA
jgi:hypothetical protein